jgi:hypothetical protein
MYKIVNYFAGIEILGLLGFIVFSRYQNGDLTRLLPLLISFLAIVYVAYSKATGISKKEVFYVAIMASAIFVSAMQFLGFIFYPGLAKDIEFLSTENLIRTVLMLIIGTFGHTLLLTVVRIWRS